MDPLRGGGSRMHPHYAQDYRGRNRAGMDTGGELGRFPPSRGIPPTAMPSLSTGQGYYTVESLQGATVVPPAQISHLPSSLPRFAGDPFVVDDRIHGPRHFDISREPPTFVGRTGFHSLNPPAPIHHGPDHSFILHPHPPPPYFGGPHPTGFHPGFREQIPACRGPLPWAPEFGPHHRRGSVGSSTTSRIDNYDRFRHNQRSKDKKQVHKRVTPDAKVKRSLSGPVTQSQKGCASEGGPGWCSVCQIDCRTSETLKKHLAGKRHKRQLESDNAGNISNDVSEESKKVAAEDPVPTECEIDSIVTDGANPESAAADNLTCSEHTGMDRKSEASVDTRRSDKTERHNDAESQDITNKMSVTISVSGDISETLASTTSLLKNGAEPDRLVGTTRCKDDEISKEGASEKHDSLEVIHSVQSTEMDKVLESPSASNKRAAHGSSNATSTLKKARVHSSPKNKPFRQVCELCNITCTSKTMLENHLKTQEHLADLNKSTGSPTFKDSSETEIASTETQVQ